ncbi:MAG: LysM peptidoglycan-binding domain-containing protein [Chloroflexi bacterium]|nr:MAG: LysM peptidoglycan-binding domain-containing protein [Chloroflexota bacterium]
MGSSKPGIALNLNMIKRILPLLLAVSLLFWASPASAQDPTPAPVSGPIYIIQLGDSLSSIASRFGVSLNDLMAANGISDANNISAGAQIIIPGLEGVTGILDTELVGYGDTLLSLSRRNQVPESFLRKLNHITSPAELYAGVGLVLPKKENFTPLSNRATLAMGETLLEAAVREQSDPWTLATLNGLDNPYTALPGDILYAPGETGEDDQPPGGLPSAFLQISASPLPVMQGRTAKIIVKAAPGVTLGGLLVDKPLRFFPLEDGRQVALQGIHALLEPGPYPLRLEATLPDGSKQTFEQMIIVQTGYYPDDPLLVVPPEFIDPVVTANEIAQVEAITAPANPARYWQGLFQGPDYFKDGCFTSRYGNRRKYIGQGTELEYYSFHTGLDFCGGVGVQITAPADGVVVLAGPLTIRGNATIIDHGWGVYSGIWHQSEIKVAAGQTVKAGDVIGLVGGTGRVTGAHLHWELWVNGIQVNPMEWLETTFP